jgi:glycerol uptake facilitator protein
VPHQPGSDHRVGATKKVDWSTAAAYIGAQLVGAVLGALLTLVMLLGNDPAKLGLGSVGYNAATSGLVVALAAEAIGTAVLVFTVFGSAVDGRAPAGFAGIIIGFIVYGIIILVGPITGAALNPARQVGPLLVEGLIGYTKFADHLSQLFVYLAGPVRGGLVGAFLYEYVGHHRTAEVSGVAVSESAHADAYPERGIASDGHPNCGASQKAHQSSRGRGAGEPGGSRCCTPRPGEDRSRE